MVKEMIQFFYKVVCSQCLKYGNQNIFNGKIVLYLTNRWRFSVVASVSVFRSCLGLQVHLYGQSNLNPDKEHLKY